MKSQVQAVARKIYDESPAMENATRCLSWRPTVKKKADPEGFVAELTMHIKSQKETLKQLLQHKDEMTAECQEIERSYKAAVEEAAVNGNGQTVTVPATAAEMADLKAERERLAKQKEDHMAHLNKVQEAEEELQRKIEPSGIG